jgi:hypothetical protein
MSRFVKEAREIRLHARNIRREEDIELRKARNPTIRSLMFCDRARIDNIQVDK